MQKDLDPIIDKAAKRILSVCTDLLVSNREISKIAKWHDIQQQNLLPKSLLIGFVEEFRPTASIAFLTKYCEMSSAYYASCAKGFFVDIKKRSKKIKKIQPVLIGDPVEGDDIKSRRRSSFSSFFGGAKPSSVEVKTTQNAPLSNSSSSSSSSSASSFGAHDVNIDGLRQFIDIPFDCSVLLVELLRRESSFFKDFFGESYIRRKTLLTKIFAKCFSIIKANLKEIIHDNMNALDSLKMMSKVTEIEVQVASMSDLSAPTQWLNEIQNCLFEDFKRLIRRQIESLLSYSELKLSLSSGELRHHFVVKRFANFMKAALEILKTFQRPWDIVQVELKKLEHSFYTWMAKISGYIKDRREGLIFQINNYDLVIETCSEVAGADFMASLQFKFDPLVEKYLKFEMERYFYDLLVITKNGEASQVEPTKVSEINSKVASSVRAIMETFKSTTFTDFSNFTVSEQIRLKFGKETVRLYAQYLEIYDSKFGKLILNEGDCSPAELELIEKIVNEGLK